MPLLKHAKKKLKQDKKRTVLNKKVKNTFKDAVKNAKAAKSTKTISVAFKAIDKAVKKNIIHKNKAARIKSSLSKLVGSAKTTVKAVVAKPESVKSAKPKAVAKPKARAKAAKKTTPKKK